MPIETLLQPNAWSCLPTCAAMIAGVEPRHVIEYIGHDGSQIVWEELSDPHRRRGFHLQEIIDFFLNQLMIPVLIEANPVILPYDAQTGEPMVDEDYAVKASTMPEERLMSHINDHHSILLGVHNDNPHSQHAVVWDYESAICHDPRGSRYQVSDFIIEGAVVLF